MNPGFFYLINMISKKSIIIDLILVILTGGIWNVWMQYRQIRDYNKASKNPEYSFFKWFLFSLITFGLYHIYHEYKLTRDIAILANKEDSELLGLIAGVVSATGLWIFVDLYQQELLNQTVK